MMLDVEFLMFDEVFGKNSNFPKNRSAHFAQRRGLNNSTLIIYNSNDQLILRKFIAILDYKRSSKIQHQASKISYALLVNSSTFEYICSPVSTRCARTGEL